jgi:hypothetical protein
MPITIGACHLSAWHPTLHFCEMTGRVNYFTTTRKATCQYFNEGSVLEEQTMANEPEAPYQPQKSQKEFQAERANKDYEASIETGRAATQAAILINGGAATALLTFLSKQVPPPPQVVTGASWSLFLYTVGVAFGALSMWSSAYSSGFFGQKWEDEFFDRTKDQKEEDKKLPHAMRWEKNHRAFVWISFLSFLAASLALAFMFLRYGIIEQVHPGPQA